MSEWQPIETVPRDNSGFLLWNGKEQFVARWGEFTKGEWGWIIAKSIIDGATIYYGRGLTATHWMSLPEPPK